MGRGVWSRAGGILSLADFVEEYRDALAYHLITLGLRLRWLGSSRLTWEDLRVIVAQSPPGSPLHRAKDDTRAAWDSGAVSAYLLAVIADQIAGGNWQRAGRKNAPKPKPIERPGDNKKGTVLGSEPVKISEFDEWWENAGPQPATTSEAESE